MPKLLFAALLFALPTCGFSQKTSTNWQQIRGSGPTLKILGDLMTRESSEIDASPWSVGCETLDRDYTIFENYKDYVGELGVKSARLQGGWAKCEKTKGVYDFEWIDKQVEALLEQGVTPWISLSYGNPLYGSEIRLGAKVITSSEALEAWGRWVEATVTRYKDVVTEWEVWNEPNLSNKDKNKGSDGYKEYAELLSRTITTIEEVQPQAKIIGFATAGIPLDFIDSVFKVLEKQNKASSVDYVSYHPYAYNPDEVYPEVEKLKILAASYNQDIELFQGENAAPSDNHYGYHALTDYPWTEISQAKWYMRRMAGDRVRDIRTSVFSIIDIKYPEVLLSMGLLRSNLQQEVIYKKPSFYAVQHMVSFFDSTALPLGLTAYTSNASRKMTVARFEKENLPIALVWYNDKIPSDALEWDLVDLTIPGVNFKDPVYVELISGKVYEIPGTRWQNDEGQVSFKDLPVWDSVIMIAERSLVNLKKK